jgi:ABC-type bacteriocin/lantibiotic exporter with double-glycine peptidase domain
LLQRRVQCEPDFLDQGAEQFLWARQSLAIGLLAMMVAFGGGLALVAVATTSVYLLLRCVAYGPYRRASEESIV